MGDRDDVSRTWGIFAVATHLRRDCAASSELMAHSSVDPPAGRSSWSRCRCDNKIDSVVRKQQRGLSKHGV
jgi:hypothetical protein